MPHLKQGWSSKWNTYRAVILQQEEGWAKAQALLSWLVSAGVLEFLWENYKEYLMFLLEPLRWAYKNYFIYVKTVFLSFKG